jgi:GPH family glycoside/pentoside/hexuronide:cation symporter
MQKCASGIGIFLTGLILAAAQFPEKAVPGQVDVAALDRLTLFFIIATLVISAVSAAIFLRFPFGEAEHNARIAALAVASAQKG